MICRWKVSPGDSVVKNLLANAGDIGSISVSGSPSGGGNGNPFHYSCLKKFMDRGAWRATVHRAAKSWTQLSEWTCMHYRKKKKTVKELVTQSCLTLRNPTDCSPPGFSVHGFSRQEYWSGWPFSSPGDLPNPGIQLRSPALQADFFFTIWATRETMYHRWNSIQHSISAIDMLIYLLLSLLLFLQSQDNLLMRSCWF